MPTAPESFAKRHMRRKREEARGTKQQRGYGGEWERISRLYRDRNPVCEMCCDAAADDVDHIRPFNGVNDPKRTEWANLQSLCRKCHNIKTTHGQKRMEVVFVTGDPGSGKSTYVDRNKSPDDVVWDMDRIAAAMNPDMGRGSNRPDDVMAVLYGMRQQILRAARGGLLNRRAWIVWTDEKNARDAMWDGCRMVRCVRNASGWSASVT